MLVPAARVIVRNGGLRYEYGFSVGSTPDGGIVCISPVGVNFNSTAQQLHENFQGQTTETP
jgi:hypothetical protein